MPKDWPGPVTDGGGLHDVDGNAKGNTGKTGTDWPGIVEKPNIRGSEPGPESPKKADGYSKPGMPDDWY